jgi:hypothetical protein
MERVVIGNATLYFGDCREILPALQIGALVCDPPYGMDYKSNHNKGSRRMAMVRKDGDFNQIVGDKNPFDPTHL